MKSDICLHYFASVLLAYTIIDVQHGCWNYACLPVAIVSWSLEFGKNQQKLSVRINWLLAGHLQDYCVFYYLYVCCTSFTSVKFAAGAHTLTHAHASSPSGGELGFQQLPSHSPPVLSLCSHSWRSALMARVLMWLGVQDKLGFLKRNGEHFYWLGIREESG